jgi:hypothetical protein
VHDDVVLRIFLRVIAHDRAGLEQLKHYCDGTIVRIAAFYTSCAAAMPTVRRQMLGHIGVETRPPPPIPGTSADSLAQYSLRFFILPVWALLFKVLIVK